ncbi:MAG: deoxynucleoside kinase [bacterium]
MKTNKDKRIILGLAGNIGVGKTSVLERLSIRWGWDLYKEPASENPYLKLYYREPERWGLHSQIYFLVNRFEEELKLSSLSKSYILDRTIYEDGEIFARVALGDEEYKTYYKFYRLAQRYLCKPDLIVYLKAPVDILISRIRKRKRLEENSISIEYLAKLNELYEDWAKSFKKALLVTYDATEDIIDNFEKLANFIEEYLKDSSFK